MTTSGHRDTPLTNAQPRVAIIVLTWNGRDLTLQCIESLLKMKYARADIVVVDNGSSDGTVEAVTKAYGDGVTLIANDDNLGYAEGNNVGIRHALQKGAEYVLLLNNDTVVDPQLLSALVGIISSSSDIGIVGPKIFYADPSNQIWFAGGEVFLSRGIARHIGIREVDRGQFDTIREVDYITGCALLARREVFEEVGLLDASYEAYFEDTDFCMRAKQHGYRILYVPDGRLWHLISWSTGGQLSRRKASRKFKSSLRFFRRYASLHHWLTIPLFFVMDVLRIGLLILGGRIRNPNDAENAAGQGGNQP